MNNGKKMMNKLKNRKKILIQELKVLNKEKEYKEISTEKFEHKKREIERELVEIMDRLIQLGFIFKK